MATVRHKVFHEAEPDRSRDGQIIEIDPTEIAIKEISKIILERVDDITDEIPITEAEIIVSGGRGVGGEDGFKLIRQVAETLGGSVGASRAAVDSSWIPFRHQVGQTGKTVAPKLYIACGISGAIQHRTGMQTSDFIVAINTDKSAPIFDIADIGLVGDLFEVLPILLSKIKNYRS